MAAVSDDMGDVRWMTYAELGQARGISTASATRLAFRRKWLRQAGNDGTARVAVPLGEVKPSTDKTHDNRGDDRGDINHVISALEDAVGTLREQLDQANSRTEAERSRADRAEQSRDRAEQGREAERARVDAADADRRAADARADKAEQANVVLREQIEATKAEVASLQTRLATVEAEGAAEDIKTAELTALAKQARTEAEAAVQAADDLQQADEARRLAGLWTRLRRAWRGD